MVSVIWNYGLIEILKEWVTIYMSHRNIYSDARYCLKHSGEIIYLEIDHINFSKFFVE